MIDYDFNIPADHDTQALGLVLGSAAAAVSGAFLLAAFMLHFFP